MSFVEILKVIVLGIVEVKPPMFLNFPLNPVFIK